MSTLFFSAFVLGFVFNAAPGAVFAETIRQGVKGGFKPALAVQFGSLVGDALWAVLGLAGVGLLLQIDFLRFPVGIAGAIYLLWLAWDSWQEANRDLGTQVSETVSQHRKALRSGILLSITNPQNIAYWAALGSAMGAMGIAEPVTSHYLVFFSGFMASSVLWSFVCAGIVAQLFRRPGANWMSLTYRACAVIFLLLAISSIRNLWDSYIAPKSTAPLPPIHSEL
ncbi:MAG: chemotaxis protein [Leptolyngbya foveolarum]|uniref:Chemotaxis protein n=1 Tax=Leptolyngbya foveolarum TaxID=47253 RepID=A0A2W4U4T4_9CYAN|nr:MAG: chemotaxis protein [Leptolyngbya foveolarum]